jgi:aminotransferase in exopolysaccharide biosynthesis|tara:strand:- start:5725 stop:6891 length:1167 start_codon:yes stop_codon:yes gene_type:complete
MSNRDFTDAFVAMVREVFSTNEFIPLHSPHFEGQEKELVLATLESTFVSSVGTCVEQFEEGIARYTGAKFAVAVSSGTAALHTALHIAGVAQDDEVITTPLTFVATCNAISYCGARPVFVDVDRNTLGLCPKSLAQFLEQHGEVRVDNLCWNRSSGKVIRACVPVHNLGHPARAEEIVEICSRYNITVIEDAAESLGSLSGGQHTGRVGLVGVLSFNGNKIITTGGGGALITDDAALAKRAKHLTTTAKRPHPWLFQHDEVGFNYRLPNLNAALGLAQMAQLDNFVAKKRSLAKYYAEWLGKWPQATFFTEPAGTRSNYWLNAILLRDRATRDEFLGRTNERGIMTRPMWTPMYTLPMYQNCQRFSLDNADLIESRLVNIPSSAVTLP